MTPVILNKIARAAGLKSGETGKVKWTVEASRGGVIKQSQASAEISMTRPDGEIPEQLYLRGTATENNGETPIPFRKVSDGIFVVYTQLDDGNLYFNVSSTNFRTMLIVYQKFCVPVYMVSLETGSKQPILPIS